HGERRAAQPQQYSRLPHGRRHGRSRRDRRPDRIPPSRRDDRFSIPLTGRGAFISLPRSGGGSGWGLMSNEHFVVPPHWEWYILLYFFFAGLAGGAFVIGTMLRLFGTAADWLSSDRKST